MMIIFYTPPPRESRIFEQFNKVFIREFMLGGRGWGFRGLETGLFVWNGYICKLIVASAMEIEQLSSNIHKNMPAAEFGGV